MNNKYGYRLVDILRERGRIRDTQGVSRGLGIGGWVVKRSNESKREIKASFLRGGGS